MKEREQGMTLIVTLIILILVTFLGIAALRMGFMQNSISFNSRIETMAFQGAEAGLRDNVSEALADNAGNVDGLLGATIAKAEANGVANAGGQKTCAEGSTACVTYRCMSRTGAAKAACGTDDRMDANGKVKVETQTRLAGVALVVNSSANMFSDYQFESQATGCLVGGSDCLGKSINVQEYKRMAPQDATSNMN